MENRHILIILFLFRQIRVWLYFGWGENGLRYSLVPAYIKPESSTQVVHKPERIRKETITFVKSGLDSDTCFTGSLRRRRILVFHVGAASMPQNSKEVQDDFAD